MKSIYLQKDKSIFDLSEYPAEEFAASMGLPGAPQIKFGNQKVKEKKRGGDEVVPAVEESVVTGRDVVASDDEDESEADDDVSEEEDGSQEASGGEEDKVESEEDEVSASESDEAPKVCFPVAFARFGLTSRPKHRQ